ncbi:mannosyl-oligosaccharide alpha-1,2-mannosidase [Sporothrix brasiliensis 5110]|uniref:alpha-1,2-Mannosidase n=1 Tax=Sporothrix brasiliensis 5110 TaxID=1398154 RepID=A0A0C2IJV5_9PEZI|nr:mannosyl-oligosaccharide alpha-1,2-mannosidase [Sporothrix brasiliensis 5110]KIH87250.1 mannosyl-oligosaccharide alpha-1,2-mannosidase [Sporothrix brasiliensis 5110]
MHVPGALLGAGTLAVLATSASASPTSRRNPKPHYVSWPDRAEAVKTAFQISWDGYYKYAFPHDSLKPVSKTFQDDRNGWGASAVDALSTALVMENEKAIGQILAHVQNIDFNSAVGDISLFETTIRYLGGLLSGYDLLTTPGALAGKHDSANKTQLAAVLSQAQHLADNLKVAFDTPSGIPDNDVLFGPPRRGGSATNGIATIGTLVLEWTRLSDLTGDPQYGKLAQKGEAYLLNPQPQALAEPFPGLVGSNVNITTGEFVDGNGGWVGGDDSFYEYLIKMYIYDPVRFAHYKDRWVLAVESSMKHLASHPASRPDLTFLAMFAGTSPRFVSQHLACFDGGNIILGGLVLNEPRYVAFGLELAASCHDTYTATATRIGPETFAWQDDGRLAAKNASNNAPPPADQADFSAKSGFWIQDGQYVLRPEVIESYYYAYRATGDPKYQDWAWDAFLAINKTCAAGSGYSSVNNVNAAGGGSFQDFQESFWFAEVLKYSYLIQSDDAPYQVQVDGSGEFVYNTECHPVRIANSKS